MDGQATNYSMFKSREKLDQLIEGVGSFIARLTGQNKLEIQHIYWDIFAIDLERRTCDCRNRSWLDSFVYIH